ncbi:MAG: DsrE/DsrF/DrsH-like family protein [Nitrospinae bacterium]|nr:DsrE/DsrF/DrsH-like family protein [Nitrospinota bacterium]
MSEEKPKRIAIIALHGTLDLAYPPLILAGTAIAMDMEAAIFFTFYGLDILKKDLNLRVPPLANPAMPHPVPGIPMGVPNIIGVLPGMTAMATMMMKGWMNKAGVMPAEKLIQACIKGGVRMIACQMTMDVMGVKREDLIDGIEIGGAGTFLDYACDADVTLSF